MAADEANEEVARLRALERLRILYTEREVAFDALTAMIRGTLDADFALVTLISGSSPARAPICARPSAPWHSAITRSARAPCSR